MERKGYPRCNLFILLFGIICGSAGSISGINGTAPNVIFILADDMGINDLGCYGQTKILTPVLDRMAAEGMRFTQHYAGSTVCAPSRCALMTGLHSGHGYIKGNFAMEEEGNLPLPAETVTVAEIFHSAGYATGIMGKWGLGGPNDHGHPNSQGFDHSLCYLDQRLAHEYYPPHLWKNQEKRILDNAGEKKNEYSHDLFTKEALWFIRQNRNSPFFLYLPYTIPHGKYQVPENLTYAGQPWSETNKNYAAMISRMDTDIGKIFSLLDSLGLDENTLVFFASDNGGTGGPGRFFESNAPFRGAKTDLYEGGIRIPLIVRWPEKIQAGTVSNHVSAFWDFLPTICDLLNTDPPTGTDGISYLPELLGTSQSSHKLLFWEYFDYNYNWKPGAAAPRNFLLRRAVRTGDWKLVQHDLKKNPVSPPELYNLGNDPGEKNDLSGSFPEKVKELLEMMENEHQDTEYFKANR